MSEVLRGGSCRWAWLAAGLVASCQSPPSAGLSDQARQAIADSVRAESERMVTVMRGRNVDSVLAFYGKETVYAGNGAIGDWAAIVAGAGPRYAGYTKVECGWGPLRIDVRGTDAVVLTGVLTCEKADTSGKAWKESTARTEVLAHEAGRWRIVAVHESTPPGEAGLH